MNPEGMKNCDALLVTADDGLQLFHLILGLNLCCTSSVFCLITKKYLILFSSCTPYKSMSATMYFQNKLAVGLLPWHIAIGLLPYFSD